MNDIYYSMEEKVVHNFQHFFKLCETEINEFEDYLINFVILEENMIKWFKYMLYKIKVWYLCIRRKN